ncbi:outer membrane beta-barrel protein [Sulfurimonas diazotrophicus]|uniref:Outer membrane beta-barrel protein n=1 Tax=Sulfurimonas diazotrophicus TaxID=3131939 RepID=A0ABZ3H923_9BACT
MKRFIVIMALCLGVLHAEATLHVGLGGIAGSENFRVKNPGISDRKTSATLQGVQLKLGYGSIRSYAVELDLGYGRYDKNIFSERDSDYVYFDISLIKAFDLEWGFYPFFKLGFGTGELEVRRTVTKSVSSGSFFAGLGGYLPLGAGFDLEASVIYRGKSWEDLDMISNQTETTSSIFEPYIGINFRF